MSGPPPARRIAALTLALALGGPAAAQDPEDPAGPTEAPGPEAPPPDAPLPDDEAPAPPPPDDGAGVASDAEAPSDPQAARRAARKARREARWEGRVPPPEADFLRTDVELKLRVAFNGYLPGPFSLFTAFAGWNEFSLAADAGVATWRDFTFAVGGSAHIGQGGILGVLTQPIANYDDYRFRWSMWDAGGSLRGSMHYTRLASVDPYLVVDLGAGAFGLTSRVREWPTIDPQQLTRPYLRIGAGGGLSFRLSERWVVGGELRYLITSQFGRVGQLEFRRDEEEAVFVLFPQHRPPKGFSWVIHVGYRFP